MFLPNVPKPQSPDLLCVCRYWEELIKPLIPLDTYVVDFAVLSTGKVVVIELNPFKNSTGGGLFSWNIDRCVFVDLLAVLVAEVLTTPIDTQYFLFHSHAPPS